MPLPYPTKVVLPFDIATAQDMNERHANDVALANGSGLDDGAVTADKIDPATYSTTEKVVGTWIDSKTIYRKTISLGTLPNNTSKNVAHSISNLDMVVDFACVAKFDSGSHFPIPFISSSTLSSQISLTISSTNVSISTGSDRSSGSAHITLWYTKT